VTPPLFDLPDPQDFVDKQDCDRCNAGVRMTDDQLRVRGWIVFDGPSVTGKQLHIRICRDCQVPKDTTPSDTDWDAYRKCSQVCGVETGQACVSLSGTIAGGRPDGVRTELARPHRSRKLRTRGVK